MNATTFVGIDPTYTTQPDTLVDTDPNAFWDHSPETPGSGALSSVEAACRLSLAMWDPLTESILILGRGRMGCAEAIRQAYTNEAGAAYIRNHAQRTLTPTGFLPEGYVPPAPADPMAGFAPEVRALVSAMYAWRVSAGEATEVALAAALQGLLSARQ
jgi:hypothetical protein